MLFQDEDINRIFEGKLPQKPTQKQIKILKEGEELIKKKAYMRCKHGTFIYHRGKLIGHGVNSSFGSVKSYHSELVAFFDSNLKKINGAVMYNIRLDVENKNGFLNSAPCHKCTVLIKKYMKCGNISKVIFTMSDGLHTFRYDDF